MEKLGRFLKPVNDLAPIEQARNGHINKLESSENMPDTMDAVGTMHYTVQEAVGVFPTAGALESAVEKLGMAGVDLAAISVLGIGPRRSNRIDALYQSAKSIGNDPESYRAAFISHAARIEGEAIAVAFPMLIGGFAGAWAVAAAGGALIVAIGTTILGAAIGATLGVMLCRAVAQHHAANIQSQLACGGMVLWVKTPDDAAEQRALAVLRHCGGKSVHTHTVEQVWGVADSPLYNVQPDPFLEHSQPSA